MEKVIFKDLYDYIQVAERDKTGMNYPDRFTKDAGLHIYEGRKQVNIHLNGKPVVNFIFENDNCVKVYPVKNSIADYNNGLIFTTYVNLNRSNIEWIHHIDPTNWGTGEAVRGFLLNFLIHWKRGLNEN